MLGAPPAADAAQIARVGFVAQQNPLYPSLTVADHLRLGEWLNPLWDADAARQRVAELGLDPKQRAGRLSGGQHAQLALTLALAKRPQLLVLDEPVASLDPLARHEFLQRLMQAVAEDEMTVLLSSHLVADLERVCDYLIVLTEAQVRLAGDVDDLLASHHRLSGPRRDPAALPSGQQIIEASHTDRQSTYLIRTDEPIIDPAWTVEPVGLEELVLAYMRPIEHPRARRLRSWEWPDDPAELAAVPHPGMGGDRSARDRRCPARARPVRTWPSSTTTS